MNILKQLGAAALMMAIAATASAQLPSTILKDIDGNSVDTATLSNDGKPYVISFFATWCKPCLRELKAIGEVYDEWQEETGMKVIAVSVDEAQTANKVKPLVDSEGWEYEVLLDPNSDFARQMGVQYVPHMIIVDGQGKVAVSRPGYTDGSEDEVIETIRQLAE